jgi:NAD(P)-dependent dehydrogenase (short-subunit alcohol dehydrogenase family)
MPVVVVTGSTRGLGFALADAFLAAKCTVVVSGREEASVQRALTTLRDKHSGARIDGLACDVSRFEDAQRLLEKARDGVGAATGGRVDFWINNAGLGGRPSKFSEQRSEDIGPVVAANLIGTMNGARVAAAAMKMQQGGGQIFNTEGFGSSGSRREGMAVYGATKQAVRYFTRSLVDELDGTPVIIGTIVPGLVVTDMLIEQARAATPRRRGLYEAAADLPETVAAGLVPRILANKEHGAVIAWLTPIGFVGRLLSPSMKKRGLFAGKL